MTKKQERIINKLDELFTKFDYYPEAVKEAIFTVYDKWLDGDISTGECENTLKAFFTNIDEITIYQLAKN